MRIAGIRSLEGPSVYHARPVLVMELHLDELDARESREFPGFNEALLALLPGLRKHHCGLGREGGFVQRLFTGTYFGHIVEHVALELAGLLGSPVTYGKTRESEVQGMYRVVVRYRSEHAMRRLLVGAVDLVERLLRGEATDVGSLLAEAEAAGRANDLGPSTMAIVRAAARRGIPWRRLNDANLVQLGYGANRQLIQASITGSTGHVAVEIASDKALTKHLLWEAGVRVPDGRVADDLDAALEALLELGGPVVVKPLDGNQGKGITVGVDQPVRLLGAYQLARRYSPRVIVERQLPGRDYRVLVVGGKVVSASERRPCQVVGDGNSTVERLIEKVNSDPLRGEGHERPLTRITVDDELVERLGEVGMSLDYVPAAGQTVVLKRHANLSVGGTAIDVTDDIHPETRRACERAAQIVGLDVCGVDLVTSDIGLPMDGGIVEVNAAPGLRMHVSPSEGKARDVGDAIVANLFPPGQDGRVPICAVTGTNGKTTVTRLIGHIVGGAGEHVGMTTTDGVYSGGVLVRPGDNTGPASARAVLSDPMVTAAVLETARGGILRRGLGYDWSDVGIVTNVTRDHVGQDGITDVEDLVWIKSLVAERVRDGGTLVLNADDPESAGMADLERVDVSRLNLVYYSVSGTADRYREHVAGGGTGYTVQGGSIVMERGSFRSVVVRLSEVPMLANGPGFQVENALAAAAGTMALGYDVEVVASGLRSFDNAQHNPGRANLYALGAGCVVLDYGHNPAAFRATAELGNAWGGPVVGIIGVPGDRRDDVIQEAAGVAATAFDRILVREDADLRGRAPGEVAAIIRAEVGRLAPATPCETVVDACGALRRLAADVEAGAMLVFYYEHHGEVQSALLEMGARPVASLPTMRRVGEESVMEMGRTAAGG
ncbi:MAG TPA: cyanophycin synthetase [Trueperaceae bacterium]